MRLIRVGESKNREKVPQRKEVPQILKRRLTVACIPRQEATVAILYQDILLIGSKGRSRRRAIFDSGSSYSIVRRDIAEAIEVLTPLPDTEEWLFETTRPDDIIEATHGVRLSFRFDDSEAKFSDEFVVFDDCSEEVIIGATTMQKWRITLDFETDQVHYRKKAVRLRV